MYFSPLSKNFEKVCCLCVPSGCLRVTAYEMFVEFGGFYCSLWKYFNFGCNLTFRSYRTIISWIQIEKKEVSNRRCRSNDRCSLCLGRFCPMYCGTEGNQTRPPDRWRLDTISQFSRFNKQLQPTCSFQSYLFLSFSHLNKFYLGSATDIPRVHIYRQQQDISRFWITPCISINSHRY